MKLAALLQYLAISAIQVAHELEIKAIQSDSRQVQVGDLFIAIAGLTVDASQYIPQAIANGAVAVLVDANLIYQYPAHLANNLQIPIIAVQNLAQQLSAIGGFFYKDPATKMLLIGVTGTNGKSSTCHYIAELLRNLANRTAVIGT